MSKSTKIEKLNRIKMLVKEFGNGQFNVRHCWSFRLCLFCCFTSLVVGCWLDCWVFGLNAYCIEIDRVDRYAEDAGGITKLLCSMEEIRQLQDSFEHRTPGVTF